MVTTSVQFSLHSPAHTLLVLGAVKGAVLFAQSANNPVELGSLSYYLQAFDKLIFWLAKLEKSPYHR